MSLRNLFNSSKRLVTNVYGKPSVSDGSNKTFLYNQGIVGFPSAKNSTSHGYSSGSLLDNAVKRFQDARELAVSVYGEPVTSTNSNNNTVSNSSVFNNGASFSNGTSTPATTPNFGATAKPIVYSDWSPNAQYFGMDQATAYAEHMANTAHQREVADLKAAGLNPVLGISGSGASSVSGSVPAVSSGKKVSNNAIVDVIGATAGLVATLVSKKPYLGYMVGNVVSSLGDLNKE